MLATRLFLWQRPHKLLCRRLTFMYRPNFCSECGAKILRLDWHAWTSRRFCGGCSKRLLKQRFTPPLVIERRANSPLYKPPGNGAPDERPDISGNAGSTNSPSTKNVQATTVEELVYICGARTKKGKPCSRRVQSPVRCWQHKGSPAMLPPEKLIVRE